MKFTKEQKLALKYATDFNSDENVLIIGKAGVGKSVLIQEIRTTLDKMGKVGLVAAPTGVAAIKIGGETIHKIISFLRYNKGFGLDYILIDEVSMTRCDLLDELEAACYYCTGIPKIFGGAKVILVGDPSQLPPVLKDGDGEEEYIKENYLSEYFFSSIAYAYSKWKIVELTKVFRQEDEDYLRILHNIRSGDAPKTIKYLNEHHQTVNPKGVFVTPFNNSADQINDEMLKSMPGKLYGFPCNTFGPIHPHEFPAPKILELKLGAKVMVIRNIYGDEQKLILINGDTGIVTDVMVDNEKPESTYIVIKADRDGKDYVIHLYSWDKTETKYDKVKKEISKEVTAQFVQFPLRLAWAITIHKSQGATFNELTLDMRKPLFAAGQLYVALSRGTSLDRLHLIGEIRKTDLITCPIVSSFLKDFKSGVGIKKGSKFSEGNYLKMLENRTKVSLIMGAA